MKYDDDHMLMLSGIQHYMFCPRQWALIHIEQQWEENRLTAEGQLLHQNVDDPSYRQKNGDVITLRAVTIASHSLGLYGVTDAVELLPSDNAKDAITHPRYPGFWKPYPIEYKRGRPKTDERDKVQLAAQAMMWTPPQKKEKNAYARLPKSVSTMGSESKTPYLNVCSQKPNWWC